MKKLLLVFIFFVVYSSSVFSQTVSGSNIQFDVRGFHLDLRIQVMPMPALRAFAKKLSDNGINTLIMEWEGTYPFEKHPLIPNRFAYTKSEIVDFIKFCNGLGIDVIPLQQSFGHVEYILRNEKYKDLREDQKDYSQVCPLQTKQDSILFSDLYAELASAHTSKYIHIGGDETYLLGHDARCKAKAEKEGKSKLYIDYIRMLCNIVIKMGKKPVLWADIALKYPEAINLLPKGTILIDWNYGWDMNNFGEHQKLVASGYEIWGAPAIRSNPDNYYLTQWEKHFKNIRDFIPVCRKLKYNGIVMTSWSTSGVYSAVFENEDEITDLYAIRHVYPISGFNMLIAGYLESLKSTTPLDIEHFVIRYSREQYGFDETQAKQFWQALKVTPYTVHQGKVQSPQPLSIDAMLDSTFTASATLHRLDPLKNKKEFEQYRLMTDIRVNYLQYEAIEEHANGPQFTSAGVPAILNELKKVIDDEAELDKKFNTLNKDVLYPAELAQENELRGIKARILYDRLSRKK
ncbi:MAG TPA: beta-N-acetylhexosaminidase [Mucilaginibacter sp.]|nr:beta-N-acetylhexosaminidase [Mucilaginibacter sp.]